ncbi:MAG TPA: hypothetical protein VKE69_06165, partial [Planctomycetota bacterium]|nr:hypothetical protein [Planctomycetota bacterium]
MDDLPRREFLRLVPASAAAFALRGRSAPDAAELATRFRQVPRAEAFDLASKAIREGVPLETFLGAVLLAGVHDVRPRIVGGKLHSVLVVESMFQLAAAATPAAA